ncbi:MAG: hypothetical protein GY874_02635 [Desulfobacteraceae bacterium]|nr:hypothetical protein [Desulfobacteraceae bacterium]
MKFQGVIDLRTALDTCREILASILLYVDRAIYGGRNSNIKKIKVSSLNKAYNRVSGAEQAQTAQRQRIEAGKHNKIVIDKD